MKNSEERYSGVEKWGRETVRKRELSSQHSTHFPSISGTRTHPSSVLFHLLDSLQS